MKKIIYSLVIMIAAGSLFTSCIEPIEPAGIYDLREAKARYYDALSKLRAADAMLVEASAALEQQRAEFEKKMVENQELLNQAQKLANEAQALGNEQEAFRWAQEKERLEAEREILRYTWEQQLLQAQLDLREAVSRFEMAMLDLTQAEKDALAEAIRRYEEAYQEYTNALELVTAAEAALWQAEYDINNHRDDAEDYLGGYVYDGLYAYYFYIRTGETTPEYYQSAIDFFYSEAEYYANLISTFEADPDVTEWAEELAELKDELDQVKYDRYQVTKDSIYYMANVFHDGAPAYTKAVEEWMAANNLRVKEIGGENYMQYKIEDDWYTMNKPVAPGEKGFDPYEYYGDEVLFIEGGELKGIPALEEDGSIAYAKFNYILDDYFWQISEAGDGTKPYMVLNGNDLEINANQMMKEFILGGVTETPFKYKDADGNVSVAKYGLEGAVSVLKRELVLSDDPAETPDSLKTLAEKALKLWKEDRAILDAGLANYKGYTDAKKAYDEKKAAYDKAVQDDKDGNSGLANATKALIDVLNGVVGHTDYSTPDTTTLVDAIVKFAEAREKYLPYTPYKNSGSDSTIFYYALATSPVIIDSTYHFKDLTVKLLREKPYFAQQWANFPNKPEISDATADNLNNVGTGEGAFMNIMNQLLGTDVGDVIATPTLAPVTAAMLNNGNAFYDTYEYDEADNKMIVKATGDVYENPDVAKAEAALATAEENVKKAAKAFVEVYNRFWAETVSTDITAAPYTKFDDYFNAAAADKAAKLQAALDAFKIGGTTLPLDHKCYKLETFTEPYNVVMFNGDDILYTNALGAILASVDPNKTGAQDCFENWNTVPAIFGSADGSAKSDFYKYMQAEYKYQMATALTEEVIKAIEAWIADVKAAFEANEALADLQYAIMKEYYEEYAEAFKTLTGKDAKNAKDDAAKIVTEIGEPVDYVAAGVNLKEPTIYNYTGEWAVAGKQAEFAEEYLPEYPENLAAWRTAAVQADHQIAHLEMIIEKLEEAYLAAIAVAEGDEDIPADFESVEEYLEYVILSALAEYEFMLELCVISAQEYEEALAKFEAGYDPAQIAIERLEHALANAQLKLEDAAAKLAVAEEYYNKVLTAILGEN